jgi:hypothetical protein
MSHFLTFVTNANGVVVDPQMPSEIDTMMNAIFAFNDVNLYSHGWWSDATATLNSYNLFSVGFANFVRSAIANNIALAAPTTALNIGIHWPSMLSEGSSIANLLEAASFFTMEKRADDVGETGVYALLVTMLNQRQTGTNFFKINMIGHSFGCKVVCSALQRLAKNAPDPTGIKLDKIQFNIVLLQAAFDSNDLESNQLYCDIATLPNVRILITKSSLDDALGKAFPVAHGLEFFNRSVTKLAMGAVGPSAATVDLYGGLNQPMVNAGDDFTKSPPFDKRLVLADLTPLHQANATYQGGVAGHHTDIYHSEIYSLIAKFLY